MDTKRKTFAALVGFLVVLLLISAAAFANDKKKKDIKLTIRTEVRQGEAPLPVTFVAEIDAAEGLDQYLYESSYEWVIMGSFVLTNQYTGGNPQDPSMRGNLNPMERSLYRDKHLIAKERKRAPRKKYKDGMDVKRTLQFTHEFKRAGTYFISFRLRNGKYRSQEVKITVRGDTSYDPLRDPY